MKNSIFLYISIFVLVSCVNSIPRKPVLQKTSSFINESVLLNKRLNALEKKEFKELIKQDSLYNYSSSPNGFWYKYNYKSTNTYLPKFGDILTYTYQVYNLNNTIIYSEEEIGQQTYAVDQQEIIEGLRNGLKLMNKGDIVTFLFPSHKAYGYLGDENKIGRNQPLIYKVQLNKINKK